MSNTLLLSVKLALSPLFLIILRKSLFKNSQEWVINARVWAETEIQWNQWKFHKIHRTSVIFGVSMIILFFLLEKSNTLLIAVGILTIVYSTSCLIYQRFFFDKIHPACMD